MVDVTSTTVTTSAIATPTSPAASATLGGSIDAEIIVLKSRLAAIEAAGKTGWTKAVAWVKDKWPHFVTWVALAAASPWGAAVLKAL